MRRKITTVIWGIVFLILGVLFAARALGFDFDIFFDGWWTLFIIIPCGISFLTNSDKLGSGTGLCLGILLLLSARDILEWREMAWLMAAIIFAGCGIRLIFQGVVKHKAGINGQKVDINVEMPHNREDNVYTAIFGGRTVNYNNEEFTGASLSSIFGSVTLNLRNAIIHGDVVVECTCVLGGIDIAVPGNVKVVVNCTPILGGVDNNVIMPGASGTIDGTIYVNATCILGGVDIK